MHYLNVFKFFLVFALSIVKQDNICAMLQNNLNYVARTNIFCSLLVNLTTQKITQHKTQDTPFEGQAVIPRDVHKLPLS